jgi:hypothetical protein
MGLLGHKPPAYLEGTVSAVFAPDAGYHYVASIHARLFFSGQPSWAPASEPMDADGLEVGGF